MIRPLIRSSSQVYRINGFRASSTKSHVEELADMFQSDSSSSLLTNQAPEKITRFHPFVDSRTSHSKFYLPTDFNRKNRIHDPDAPRTYGRPSGLGPSAERTRSTDPFLALDIDLKEEFRNGTLLSQFVTNMGLIKNRGETKLARGNQRKLARAVKRARNMGLLPYFSNNASNLV